MTELFLRKFTPYAVAFLSAFALTLLLVPLVRILNMRLGMVDKPDPRRINKVPVPRGGGIALIAGLLITYSLLVVFYDAIPCGIGVGGGVYWKYVVISLFVGLVGFCDDLYGMKPHIKLLGQVVAGVLVWWWADLGFHRLCPSIPGALDGFLTVFWIVGAINAFNLIDGLDGLASGLALIAAVGMGGALLLTNASVSVFFYFALAGALLAFLRYNYNPATIFLGDSGSMFIGFTLAFLPLASQASNSFLVSVGVPLLAMGVPIFDVFLAILRRSVRYVLSKRDAKSAGNGKIMTADIDHLHHRILRSVDLSQKKAAWILYVIAAFLVSFGLLGVFVESRAAGVWIAAFSVAVVVAVRDMARIELFDLGRLAKAFAHDRSVGHRRKIANLRIPITLAADVTLLVIIFFFSAWMLRVNIGKITFRVGMPIMVSSVFVMLVVCKTYVTAWARAMSSNYLRLLFACVGGSVMGGVAIYYSPFYNYQLKALVVNYAAFTFIALSIIRLLRSVVRDVLYVLDRSRLKNRTDVSRVLVYGSGLRYRAFRRELVRSASSNSRVIVGIVDDDLLLKGLYIGGIKIIGPLSAAPGAIRELNADSFVVACDITEERMEVVRSMLRDSGVKISKFYLNEIPVENPKKENQGEAK